MRTVVIDPTPFTCGRLAGELAGAVADRHAALDLSWGVLHRAGRACRSFAEWVDANHDRPWDCTAAALTVDDLERWQATIRTHYAGHSDMPGEIATSLFVTLRWLADQTETPVAPRSRRGEGTRPYPRPAAGPSTSSPRWTATPSKLPLARASNGSSEASRCLIRGKATSATHSRWPPRRPHARVARRPLWADSCRTASELRTVLELNLIPVQEDPRPQLEAWQEISEAAARHGARWQWH